MLKRALDVIADLIKRQDITTALKNIKELEEGCIHKMSPVEIGRMQFYAAEALYFLGRYSMSLERINLAITNFRDSDVHNLYGWAKCRRGNIFLEFGRHEEGKEDFLGALAAFKRIEDQTGEYRASERLARVGYVQGNFRSAKKYLLRMNDLCIKMGDDLRRRRNDGNLGRVLTFLGEFAAAKPLLEFDPDTINAMDPHGRCNWHVSYGLLLLQMREFDQAATHLEQVRLLAAEHSFAREMGIHHEYAGEMAFWEGDRDKAESHYHEAIKIGMEIAPEGDLISQSYRLLAELQVDRPGRCRRPGTLYAISPGGC